jgi:hypothetical protein
METLNINFAAFWEHELAGRIVRRSGNNWLCRSPFREDKNPSFSVSIVDGVFNDFADESLRGDAISFVQKRYGLDFKAALDYLGKPSRTCPAPLPKPRTAALVRQGNKADYTLREIVIGGADKRGNVRPCETLPDYIGTPGLIDCYHSVCLHNAGILTYQEKNGGKLAGYPGAVWCRELVFDIDNTGENIQENIRLSLEGAKVLIGRLKNAGLSSFDIAFSGCKGFHLAISSPLLDKLSGFPDTPKRVKSLAQKIAGDAIDTRIYQTIWIIRSLNSINSKSGLYKIPLSEAEIYTLTPEEIISLARNPRPKPTKYEPIRAYSKLLDEPFTIDRGNDAAFVTFDSGPTFTKREIETLRGEKDKSAIKAIYLTKKHFGGTVEKGKK